MLCTGQNNTGCNIRRTGTNTGERIAQLGVEQIDIFHGKNWFTTGLQPAGHGPLLRTRTGALHHAGAVYLITLPVGGIGIRPKVKLILAASFTGSEGVQFTGLGFVHWPKGSGLVYVKPASGHGLSTTAVL